MEYKIDYYIIILLFTLYNLLTFFIINKNKEKFLFFLIDNPDGKRKLHSSPTLIIGGVFIAIYFFLILCYSYVLDFNTLLIISLVSLLIFVIGVIDDLYSLSPYRKLFFILIIILLALNFNLDLRLNSLYFSTFDTFLNIGKYDFFVTSICLLLLINSLNLSDGINGLATGIAIIWLGFALFNASLDIKIILIPLIFLLILIFFSIYKNSFFLGDNGSLIISSFIGMIIILIYNQSLKQDIEIISVENIFILLMVQGIDMFRLFTKRFLKKKNLFKGDREHLHHLLILTFSLKKTLFIYFGLMLFFILIDYFKIVNSIYLIITYCLIYAILMKKLKKLNLKV